MESVTRVCETADMRECDLRPCEHQVRMFVLMLDIAATHWQGTQTVSHKHARQ